MTNSLLETEKDPGAVALVSGGSSGDFSNFGPVKNIKGFCSAAQEGSWQEEFTNAASLGATAISAAFHPIATITGWVGSWIIDHVHPLQDMLQEFTGDPDEINAGSSTWTNISNASGNNATDLESLLGRIADQKSKTLDAYRKQVDTLKQVFEAQKEAAAQIADTLKQQAAIADFIYGMIRDAISEAIGEFAEDVAIEVFSLGTGTPLVVAKISAWVGEKVAKITSFVNKALDAFAKLNKIDNPLKALFKEGGKRAAGQASKYLPHAAGSAPRRMSQAGINAKDFAQGSQFFEQAGNAASAASVASKKQGEGIYTQTSDNYKGLYQNGSSSSFDDFQGSGSSSSSEDNDFYEGGGDF